MPAHITRAESGGRTDDETVAGGVEGGGRADDKTGWWTGSCRF